MPVESASFIADLNAAYPAGTEVKSEGDDHLRLLKTAIQGTFPGFAGRVSRSVTKSAGYTVVLNDASVLFNCTAALTLSLTAAATLGNGHNFTVHANGGAVTIDPNGAETINGATTLVVPDGSVYTIFCNGTSFVAIVIPSEGRSDITMHATTMDLWAGPAIRNGTGSAVTMTGMANAPQAGARRTLIPPAGTIITDGAVFDVDGDASYTTLAGDRVEFEAVTVSTFKAHITRANGTAVVGSSFATSAEVKTGTESAKAIAPDALLAAQGFTARYNSGNQTITAGGQLVLAHGLGREPILITAWLKCLTAQHNYSIGDKVWITPLTTLGRGISPVADATNLTLRFGNDGNTFLVADKSTGASVAITDSYWALVMEAFA